MAKLILPFILIGWLVMGSLVAIAGPFGTTMGQELKEFSDVKDLENFRYITSQIAKPHSLFEKYILSIHPKTGLSRITAFSETFENDYYGIKAKDAYENLIAQLTTKYGAPKRNEFLRTGATWDDANDWVMSIKQNERSHQAIWAFSKPEKIKDDIIEILVAVSALDSSSSLVILQYKYSNFRDYAKELEKAATDAL